MSVIRHRAHRKDELRILSKRRISADVGPRRAIHRASGDPRVHIVGSELGRLLASPLQQAGCNTEIFEETESLPVALQRDAVGCLLIDEILPETSGLELHRALQARGVFLPTILVTPPGCVRTAVTAVQAGVCDVLERPVQIDEALQRVAAALAASAQQRDEFGERAQYENLFGRLSPREREVMLRLASNQSSKQIASELGISPKTVGVHRARVLVKMKSDGVVELTKIAHRLGIVE